MERSRVAIIIPALNEAGTIAKVVESVAAYGVPIVVDDGSTDATEELAKGAGAEVVRHPVNQGYDGALNSGFARAAALNCEYAITVDADGQHNPAQIGNFIRHLEEGCDLVMGNRHRYQRIAEVIFARVAWMLWKVSDPVCGMKAYHMDWYRKFGYFDSFHSIGTELAIRSIASGCKFIEVPIVTRERLDAPRFARTFAANMKILRAMAILVYLRLTKRLAY